MLVGCVFLFVNVNGMGLSLNDQKKFPWFLLSLKMHSNECFIEKLHLGLHWVCIYIGYKCVVALSKTNCLVPYYVHYL